MSRKRYVLCLQFAVIRLRGYSICITIEVTGGDTMAKTASISLRIEPAVKAQLEALYASFGISVTDAINIFLHTSLMEGGFPFQPKQPRYNAETEAAIQETKDILAGKVKAKSYANVKEMIEDLYNYTSNQIDF